MASSPHLKSLSFQPPHLEPTPPTSEKASLSDPETPPSPPSAASPKVFRWPHSSNKSRLQDKTSEKTSAWQAFREIIPERHRTTRSATPTTDSFTEQVFDSEIPASKPRRSKHKWHSRKTADQGDSIKPAANVPAIEGESIAPRHKLDTASIEGDFYKIEYGQLKGKPACMIIVDLRLAYQRNSTIKGTKIEFQFGRHSTQPPASPDFLQTTLSPANSMISKVFYPDELTGEAKDILTKKHSNTKPEISALGCKVGAGGGGAHITMTKQFYWRVQGRTEEHNGIYDTFGWTVFENTQSENSVPRKVRLGMVAFHDLQPFWVETTVEGSLRKGVPFSKATITREKRWFAPSKLGDSIVNSLDVDMLEDQVNRYNMCIEGVAPTKTANRQLVGQINVLDFGGVSSGSKGSGITSSFLGPGTQDVLDGTASAGRMRTQHALRAAPGDGPEEDASSIAGSVADSVVSTIASVDDGAFDATSAAC
ncbi:hypothetical protein MMC17_000592 [Xylographa soralifera]|nr:hypothetical protein [Xylographa soralifera]